jgi:uncharacterized membrane protein YdjX (TVP38/TMEM64 family)
MDPTLKTIGSTARLLMIAIWAGVIVTAVASYFSDPSRFTASNIAGFIASFQTEIWLVYFAMSVLRGFTLLPSTPLVLAGAFLYPEQPWLVLFTSMIGILVSSTLIYFCSEALGFSHYFETRKPKAVAHIRGRLEHPTGLLFISAWSFFPFAPTDAVCYVAGTMKMHFLKFIAAVFAGELVICSLYIFSGGSLVRNWL